MLKFDHYVEGRVFEWIMGLSMLYHGFTFIIWPESLTETGFRHLLWLLPPNTIVGVLLFLGWTRCSALMLNGQNMFGVQLGPFIRAGVSVITAVIWGQMAMTSLQVSLGKGVPIQGVYYWTIFTLAEIYVAYTTLKNR